MEGLFGDDPPQNSTPKKRKDSTSNSQTQTTPEKTHWPFINIKPINTISQQTKAIAAETQDGPVEYKWTLANANEERIHHLSTQMQWRLAEGNGHALYRLGIEDDGTVSGMEPKDFKKTIENFDKVVALSNAEKVITYTHTIKKPKTKPRLCADIHIRRNDDQLLSNVEKKFIIVGIIIFFQTSKL